MTYEIVSERKMREPVRLSCPADTYEALTRYARKQREHFIVITLDGAHHVQRIHIVSIGLVNRTMVHAREVFVKAISDRATAIIVAHNHPSGKLNPSLEDDEVTRRLTDAGQIIGIPVPDHLVFGKAGYYSYQEHGRLN